MHIGITNPVYHNFVEKLEPLKQYLGLTDEQLKKIVLKTVAVLTNTHATLLKEKLEPLTQHFDFTERR